MSPGPLSSFLQNLLCLIKRILIAWLSLLSINLNLLADQTKDSSKIKTYSVEELYDLPLENLLEVGWRSPAAITRVAPFESPASITSIDHKQIMRTPARNLFDLIEIYVPGAIWLNYEEGPLLGMRGSIANRNFKYLLLVNGRVMNSKGLHGAKSELEHWDMSDIQKIEFIRGPGSVTYGPGAVSGVINIITHNAKTKKGTYGSIRYVTEYNSTGFTLSHGYQKKNHNFYSHFSMTHTKGSQPENFISLNNPQAGYVGRDIKLNGQALDYFADFQQQPQIKFYTESEFQNNWKLWGRFIREGSTWRGNEIKTDFGGDLKNQQSIQNRQITLTLEHKKHLNSYFEMQTMLSFDSYDGERRIEKAIHPDPNHPQNKKNNYSEDELYFKTLVNSDISQKWEVAFGFEYSRDHYGAGWGDSPADMRLGGDGVIVSDPNSNVIGPKLSVNEAFFAGDGWETNSFAFLTESFLTLNDANKFLISGRLDHSTNSHWLFSPRIAYMKNMNQDHLLKFIVQKSARRTIAGQAFIESQRGKRSSDESITSYEVIYKGHLNKNFLLDVAAYYNDAEVIAWNSSIDEVVPLGEQKLYGFETSLQYKLNKGKINLSYSHTKQLDWTLAQNVNGSGISYSDYHESLSGSQSATLLGYGNDINNWPNQALKLNFLRFINSKLTFHADAQFLWDYQGGKDGLSALSIAAQGEADEALVNQAIQKVRDENAYKTNIRINLSLNYQWNKKTNLSVYAHNILGTHHNKRYSYDSGISKFAPHKVRFINEEKAFSFNLTRRF